MFCVCQYYKKAGTGFEVHLVPAFLYVGYL